MSLFSEHTDKMRRVFEYAAIIAMYGVGGTLAWMFGNAIGFDVRGQILLVVIVLLTFPLALLINYLWKKRASTTNEDRVISSPDNSSEKLKTNSELMQRTEEIVHWLKKTKLGSNESGEILYRLPWYLVIGPPSSGKTSLLMRAGLNFQLLPGERTSNQNSINPTKNCEWRITNNAVFIDTAGNYQIEETEQGEWSDLLATLKHFRNMRPIDGLIIAVDIGEVLKASDNDLEKKAKQIRVHIDNALAQWKIRFPIYLVFTHTDQIEGFNTFFSNFDPSRRTQVWGTTIPLSEIEHAASIMDAEINLLGETLLRNRLARISIPEHPAQQLDIFNFPLHFIDSNDRLTNFIGTLFRPTPFTDNPLLRGCYFTGLLEDTSYFSIDLMNDLLTRDRQLASSFNKPAARPQLKRNLILSAAAMILLIAVFGFTVAYINNRQLIQDNLTKALRVDELTRADSNVNGNIDNANLRVELEAMETMRLSLNKLDQYQHNGAPLSMRFGLYSGDTIDPKMRAIYYDLIDQRLFHPAAISLENELKKFAEAGDKTTFSEEDLGRYYDLLKAYLMLANPDKVESAFLANRLSEYWKNNVPDDLEILAQQQLDFFAKQAGDQYAPHWKVDDKLVANSRQKLTAYPPINRYFKRITADVDLKVSGVTLNSITQGRGKGWLIAKYSVPGSFTIEGYQKYMSRSLATAASEISKEDWVMGAISTNKDLSGDIGKLEAIYFREYILQWQKFLQGLSIPPYRNKEDAVEAMKSLSSTDSPLVLALMEVSKETNFAAAKQQSWWQKLFGSTTLNENEKTIEIEKEFSALTQFIGKSGDSETTPINQYRANLRVMLDSLESANADQLSKTAKLLLTGQDDIGLQKTELSINKLLDSFTAPAMVDAAAICKQPLGNLRAMLYGGSFAQIEQIWREQIYVKARSLEAGFPFTDSGSASITDLTRYLNPVDGQLTKFFNDRLTASFEDSQGKWQLKQTGAFKFSPAFISYLNSSRQLKDALFSQGGAQMEVGYEILLQPVANADVALEIDGTRVETRGTTQQAAKFTWPARTGTSGAKITVIQNNKIMEKAFPGEWGLFKMIAAGGASTAGDQIPLAWSVEGVTVRAILRPSSATNPFSRKQFIEWRAPQSLKE